MANVVKTVMTYQLNGQTTDFEIPFDYLARKFVKLTLLGKDRKELSLNTDYRFATRTVISLTHAWGQADGYTMLEMRRYTSATERLVDFTDGSILRAYDLNVAQLQTMHIAEEARDLTADTIGVNNDGDLDARGHRIINLAAAREENDAVSLGFLKSLTNNAWQARNEAEGFRDEASNFKDLASAEASKVAAEVDKAKQEAANAKLQADNAASAARNAADEVGKASAEAENVKQEAAKASAEVGKVQQEVGKVNEAIEKAKEQVHLAEASATKVQQVAGGVEADAERAANFAQVARQEALNASIEAGKVELWVDEVSGAVEQVREQVRLAEASVTEVQMASSGVMENAKKAEASAQTAKLEADRAKAEADKVAASNQISAALESVTQTAVTFNREVAARSHLRCMTKGETVPFTGVWREKIAELYMAVDSGGNTGFTINAPTNSDLRFKAYWDKQGETYVSNTTMNLDQGSRQIKGSLEVGQGSNSAIHTFSKGDGNPNELVSVTKWKWRNGGVELGTMRGQSDGCTGIVSTTSGGHKVSYKQNADGGTHIFLGDADKTVLTIHANGDIETPLFGRLSEKLSGVGGGDGSGGSGGGGNGGVGGGGGNGGVGGGGDGGSDGDGDAGDPNDWYLVGNIIDETGSKFISPFPLAGRRGYIKFPQGDVLVNVFFTYPPFDCTFQLPRGSSSGTFAMAKSGTELRLRIKSEDDWGYTYQFYAYNPDPSAVGIQEEEELDTGYGVFEC